MIDATVPSRNQFLDGGNVLVIGGKLTILSDAEVEGIPSTPAENQAASTATTIAGLKEDLNALLEKLKAAGLMEADPEPEPDPEPGPDET